jgi:hypothetical protein
MTARPHDPERQDHQEKRETAGTKHPAGNAIHDPDEQTRRRDLPDAEQDAEGEPLRGTAPARRSDLPPGMPRSPKGD